MSDRRGCRALSARYFSEVAGLFEVAGLLQESLSEVAGLFQRGISPRLSLLTKVARDLREDP